MTVRVLLVFLVLAGLLLSAHVVAQPVAVAGPDLPDAIPLDEDGTAPFTGPQSFQPDHLHSVRFPDAVDHAELIFDGVLVRADVRQPAGTGILVTDYTFRVREWLVGEGGDELITLTSTGGERADGSGMTICGAIHLKRDHRYIIVSRKKPEDMALPIARAIQVHSAEQMLIDEGGRVIVSILPDGLGTRSGPDYPGLSYLVGQHGVQEDVLENLIPDDADPQPGPAESRPMMSPIAPEQMLGWIADRRNITRTAGLVSNIDSSADPEPIVPAGAWCGRINGPHNYYSWVPNDDHWTWSQWARGNWNILVDDNPGGSSWLLGVYTQGGEPIRDRLPAAGNGDNNLGVVTSQQLLDGGYGETWAQMGANGVNFIWYSGGSCTRINEVDTFVNPAIANDQVQHLKTLTHEFGHALGQSTSGAGGHEERYYAIMYPGTYRQPPNYNSTWYGRMDDMRGVRSFLETSNTNYPGTWELEEWVDMATWSQTHDNWGSPGNLVMTDLNIYSGRRGDSLTVRGIQVENRGNLPASNVILRFYLSPNTTISSDDYLAGSAFWSNFPAHGYWSNGTRVIQVPGNIPAGNYFIGWQLELTEDERSTGNNTAIMRRDHNSGFQTRQFTVIGQPDLVVPGIILMSPAVAPQPSHVTVNIQIFNNGDGAAPGTTVRLYRSNSATFTTSTEIDQTSVASIPSNGVSSHLLSATLNVAGTHYLRACVDAVSHEEDTSNQCSASVNVTVTAVDELFEDRFEP